MNKDTITIKKEIGCALNTIRKAILALERVNLQNLKKILNDIHLNSYKDPATGLQRTVGAKVCQAVLYVNEKVEKNTEDIEQLKKQLQ